MSRSSVVLALLSLGAVAATAALDRSHRALFEQYLGGLAPVVAVTSVSVIGALSLHVLRTRGWFDIVARPFDPRGLALAAGLATLFALVVIAADLVIRFPEDINVQPPAALAFYPVMGYVVEMLFHVLPLTVMLVALQPFVGDPTAGRHAWLVIGVVAILEPVYQVTSMDRPASGPGLFVLLHLVALNLVQVLLFRQYDFLSMYAFRLVYYLHWHIVWGVVRRYVLFPP